MGGREPKEESKEKTASDRITCWVGWRRGEEKKKEEEGYVSLVPAVLVWGRWLLAG